MIYLQAIIYTAMISVAVGIIILLVMLSPVKIIIGFFVCFYIWYIKFLISVGIFPRIWGKK